MEITFDYHTHTVYSHGKGDIIDNAKAAKKAGLKGIAVTDHGFSHPAFGMKRKELDEMKRKCLEAEKETGVKVLLGIESNILGVDGKTDVKKSDYIKLDVFLAGVHQFVRYDTFADYFRFFGANFFTSEWKIKPSERLIKNTTKAYVNAVKNNPIDIITHVNYKCFADPVEVAKVCADYGTLFEINTKKVHLSDEEWLKILNTKVNFVIDSDAHDIDRVGDTLLADKLLSRVQIPEERILNISGKIPTLRFAEFKRKNL